MKLLEPPMSSPGLFGDAVTSVVERFQEEKVRQWCSRKLSLALPRSQRLLGGSSPGRLPAPLIERSRGRVSPPEPFCRRGVRAALSACSLPVICFRVPDRLLEKERVSRGRFT
jgi:hypothetical protein